MNADSPEDPRLHTGLERLRELGYLRSPAELFVAERVTPRASLLRTSLISGAWVGVAGGILAGLVLAVSVLVAVPELLSHPIDLAWLSFDLVLVSALGAGVLVSVLTALLLAWKRRRAFTWRPWAERVLLLLTVLPPALYLGDVFGRFLLHRVQGGSWWLAALGAALVATLLAAIWGRLLRALLAAAGLAPADRAALRSLRTIRIQTRVLVLVATVLLLLLGPYRQMRALPRLDQVPVQEMEARDDRILLVTVDGVAAADLAEALPSLGAPRQLVDAELPDHPAVFWNSLATGFEARVHGLQSASSYAPAGVSGGLEDAMRQPVLAVVLRSVLPGVGLGALRAHDQRELRRPPFWEIAAYCGRRSSVINAWATYPAARHPELSVLSDRCFLRMWEGEQVQDDSHLVHPLRADLLERAQAALATRASYPSVAQGDSILGVLPLAGLEDYREAWEFAVALDLFHATLARRDHEREGSHLTVVHLGGADILERAAKRVPEGASRQVSARLGSLHRRFVKDLLAELLLVAAPDSWMVANSELRDARRTAALFSSTPIAARSALQLAPELLWRLGVAPAGDMQIQELELSDELALPATWGRRARWTPVAERSAADLERLRSLGYIGGS